VILIACGENMVRRKKLNPSGGKDSNGNYRNTHLHLHIDEIGVAGMSIGDEVFVQVRDDEIVIRKADGNF
jgi:alanine-alpha-ketoisovalerate/valine-pyruvate aminotransferase